MVESGSVPSTWICRWCCWWFNQGCQPKKDKCKTFISSNFSTNTIYVDKIIFSFNKLFPCEIKYCSILFLLTLLLSLSLSLSVCLSLYIYIYKYLPFFSFYEIMLLVKKRHSFCRVTANIYIYIYIYIIVYVQNVSAIRWGEKSSEMVVMGVALLCKPKVLAFIPILKAIWHYETIDLCVRGVNT